jgi:hypothetical protein
MSGWTLEPEMGAREAYAPFCDVQAIPKLTLCPAAESPSSTSLQGPVAWALLQDSPVNRAGYHDTISEFLDRDPLTILGRLVERSSYAVELTQRNAWTTQITLLKAVLEPYRDCGSVYFEFSIPRLGRRIDVLAVVKSAILILEFKVGEAEYAAHALDQVCDYALDLKNFHETSHGCQVVPVLIATNAIRESELALESSNDGLFSPVTCAITQLPALISKVLDLVPDMAIDVTAWEQGRYCPTPTIIEAATALYGEHAVEEISRSDASAINLTQTSAAVCDVVKESRERSWKSICFVTGVPGAGKTLVGLNIAKQYLDPASASHSVFLSGNGPLVAILREALARDKVRREKEKGNKHKLGAARSEVKALIQNVHHFRDDCLEDVSRPPIEHVAIFDEAQRAWNLAQTRSFMKQKKGRADFDRSEPEFLISCLDRHPDWATIVCLVGGGQEINTGEAGISEWISSIQRSFPDWKLFISSRLTDSEYGAGRVLEQLEGMCGFTFKDNLHLAVSMRSFRAESVSLLVKQLLDLESGKATLTLRGVTDRYPIFLSRSLQQAKSWLKDKARGSERFGIVVSSQAQRLKPHAIDVRSPMDPVHWFLDGKEDVRSSYYLEDVATEFHVQGLELDWACVTWDADFRLGIDGWEHWSFVGDRWNRILKAERKAYLKNAYRVLLTRARQGMVIVVPEGDPADLTRRKEYYDGTYQYLQEIGFQTL